ncbi:hypothetical protein BC629DRAFT_1267559, partial [Irpex lacteus]
TSTYTIELPEDLARRRIHPTFHVSKLRRHEPNDDALFPHRETRVYYDMGNPVNADWLVEEVLDHRWKGKDIELKVRWNLGKETWEPLANIGASAELDNYLDIQGVDAAEKLPKGK